MGHFRLKWDKSKLGLLLSGKSAEAKLRFAQALREDVNVVTLELRGHVEREVLAAGKVGVSGQFSESIMSEPAQFYPPLKVSGGVFAGRDGQEVQHAKFVEFGTKKHKAKKSPMFWIRVLGPWVRIKLRPSAGINPKTGRRQTAEQATNAIAIGAGRNIEDNGIAPTPIFGKVADEKGPAALDRLAELAADRLAEIA